MMEKAVIMTDTGVITPDDLFIQPRTAQMRQAATLRLDQNEKQLIREALHLHNYKQTETSRELGISRKTLYNKMKKYSL